MAVVGSGYIGIEMAGIFNSLGTRVSIFSRSDRLLRPIDVREAKLPSSQHRCCPPRACA